MTRRYNDEEVSLILQRALEPGGESDSDPGLSLDQIKTIAAEAGIDPDRIERAALSLTHSASRRANPYSGLPTVVELNSVLPDVDFELVPTHEVVTLIRSTLDRQGAVATLGDSIEWRTKDGLGSRSISLARSKCGLVLRTFANFRDGLYGTIAVTVGVTFFVTAAALAGMVLNLDPNVILLSGLLTSCVTPRFIYRWWRKQEDAKLQSLHEKLLAFLEEDSSAAREALETTKSPAPGD